MWGIRGRVVGKEGEWFCSMFLFLSFCPAESERMRPIPVDHFSEHVRLMHQDRDKGFEMEYQVG